MKVDGKSLGGRRPTRRSEGATRRALTVYLNDEEWKLLQMAALNNDEYIAEFAQDALLNALKAQPIPEKLPDEEFLSLVTNNE